MAQAGGSRGDGEAFEGDDRIGKAPRRLSKKTLVWQGRYAYAKQMKRARKESKKLKVYLGRVMRDIQKKWTMPIRNWGKALNQFAILYGDRMP